MSNILNGIRRMIRDLENGMTAEELLVILKADEAQRERWMAKPEEAPPEEVNI